jgi:hypothetical protein
MHPLLAEGLTDAIGFVAGVLIAWGVGALFGFEPLRTAQGDSFFGGIVLAGLGGGAGVQLARKWRRARMRKD